MPGPQGNATIRASVKGNTVKFTVLTHHYFGPAGSTIKFRIYKKHGDIHLQQIAYAPKASWSGNVGVNVFGGARSVWSRQANNYARILNPGWGYRGLAAEH